MLLVHGAGTGPWVFDGWRSGFGGAHVLAIDLQAGLHVAEASMLNYEAAAAATAALLERPLLLVGWSMGGLAAMMAARRVEPDALVLLEPSPSAQLQGHDETIELRAGTYDPEETYGRFPGGVRKRPESLLARAERKRGISVLSLPARTLVLYGTDFPSERGRLLASHYGVEALAVPTANHWQLVLGDRGRDATAAFAGV